MGRSYTPPTAGEGVGSSRENKIGEAEMNEGEIADVVLETVANQLNKKVGEIDAGASLKDLGADSLDAVEIVMNLEDHFDVNIDDDKIEGIKTLGQFVEIVAELLDEK
jgi:acyl carrier protein